MEIKTDLTETLVALDYFLGQFYDYNHDSSMTTIKFSLDGFTEAINETDPVEKVVLRV